MYQYASRAIILSGLSFFAACNPVASYEQNSSGSYSPNVSGVGGNVTIYQSPQGQKANLGSLKLDYLRMFGAVSANVVFEMWRNGGAIKEGSSVGDGRPYYTLGEHGIGITEDLAVFLKDWEYRKVSLLNNPVVEKWLASDASARFFGEALDFKKSATKSDCVSIIVYSSEDGEEKTPKNRRVKLDKRCDKKFSERVAYLILLIENPTLTDFHNVEVAFKIVRLAEDDGIITHAKMFTYNKEDVEQTFQSAYGCRRDPQDGECGSLFFRVISYIKAGQKLAWPIMAYVRDSGDDFRGRLLDDAAVPVAFLDLDSSGKDFLIIRPPLREQAIRVVLPFGTTSQ